LLFPRPIEDQGGMERLPLHGEEETYGTGEATRVHTKRKGSPSAKCLVASSAIIVAVLVGALHFVREEPSTSASSEPKPARAKHAAHHALAGAKATAHKISVRAQRKETAAPKSATASSLRAREGVHPGAGSATSLSAHELAQLPADVRVALNTSVDPCDNFYEFACGSWDSATTIPNWQSSWAKQWDGVTTDVETKAVKALEKDDGPAGKFYQSCMDTATVQKLGSKPLKPWLAAAELVKDHESLVKGLAAFALADMTAFFGWWVDADSQDSSLNSFFVAQGGITMPDRSYYLDRTPEMERHRKAYKKMVVNIMKLSGRSAAEALADAHNVMALETEMARAMKPDDEERDEHGRRISVADMSVLMPTVDWAQFLRLIGTPGVGTQQGGFLVVKNEAYLRAVDKIIKSADFAQIRSYLRWNAVYSFAPYLSYPFEDELVAYNNDLYGISVLPPRWRKCYFATGESMDMALSKLFVEHYFPDESRQKALEMLTEIRGHLNESIHTRSWMDGPTKVKAVAKLDNMFLEVGRPSKWPPSAFERYEQWGGIHAHRFFDNVVATNSYDVQKTMARLGKPIDRRRWGSSSCTDVNSYYSRKVNGIFIPAGILQAPFYSATQAVARNYGSVGCICGHEMTHGFDDIGREYDANGNRNGWWSQRVIGRFKERADCIQRLYSSFTEYGHHVNGKLTLGEAIADSGGLKFSWESFVGKTSVSPDLAQRKLFFIAMGQTWCEKQKKEGALAALLTDQHPPTKYRVLGTLSQFAPFAETFSCPAGSRMNPASKCDLW
jgi:putative endopeptidase